MYPKDFFDTFWRPELRNEVFVAMPFSDEFLPMWERAYQPAIEQDLAGGFQAIRVDISVLTGGVVPQIMDRIAHARVVLADISVAREGRWAGQRNGNVMYEVGVAHAVRQSSEVVLVRSDEEPINFDIAGIQVHRYNAGDLDGVRELTARLVRGSLDETKVQKGLRVQRALDSLDDDSLRYLALAGQGAFVGPNPKTMGEELVAVANRAALARLQAAGIIRTVPTPGAPRTAYELTAFGRHVLAALG